MTSLGSNARTKNFVCETINTLSKPVQDAYINTLHYTALDPPVGGASMVCLCHGFKNSNERLDCLEPRPRSKTLSQYDHMMIPF